MLMLVLILILVPMLMYLQRGTPLHVAACHGHCAVMQVLLTAGASTTHPNGGGETSLHVAATASNLHITPSHHHTITPSHHRSLHVAATAN